VASSIWPKSVQKNPRVRERTGVEATVQDELEAQVVAQLGDAAQPLEEIFRQHGAYVARALTCLGVRERELPDACQEVFLVVHRRLPEFEGRASIRTWLYAICVRRALSQRRRAARRREDATPLPAAREVSNDPGPDEHVERRRALGTAMQILERLDDEKRAVFVLYEVEQLPMSEVADALELPLQTAYSRLYAARRDVARILCRLRAQGKVE